MVELAKLFVTIGAKTDQFEKGLTRVAKRIKFASKAMVAFGGAIVGALALATKAAIDFEDAFAGVRKTVDATEAEFAVLRQGVRDLAKELPLTNAELAGIAEAAGQLGIEKAAILDFTKVMAQLGLSTNLTGDEAATTFARFANITGMDTRFFSNLGSVIVDLGNNLATTEREIADLSLRLAGAGTIAGLTEADILGLSAAISSVGIRAESGGTAFAKVILEMNSAVLGGGKALEKFANIAGTTTGEFAAAFKKDAAGAIIEFIKGLKRLDAAGIDIVPILEGMGLSGIRVTDALLRAAGATDTFADALEIANDAWAENNALAEEAAKRLDTTKSKLAILRNKLIDVGVTLGDAVLPALTGFVDKIGNTIEGIQKWTTDNPELTKTLVKVGGAIGGILAGFGGLALALPTILKTFRVIRTAVIGLSKALIFLVTNPIALLLTILTVMGLAIAELARRNSEAEEGFKGVAEEAEHNASALDDLGVNVDQLAQREKDLADILDFLKTKREESTASLAEETAAIAGQAAAQTAANAATEEALRLAEMLRGERARGAGLFVQELLAAGLDPAEAPGIIGGLQAPGGAFGPDAPPAGGAGGFGMPGPMVIENNLILDGEVLGTAVNEIVGNMVGDEMQIRGEGP